LSVRRLRPTYTVPYGLVSYGLVCGNPPLCASGVSDDAADAGGGNRLRSMRVRVVAGGGSTRVTGNRWVVQAGG